MTGSNKFDFVSFAKNKNENIIVTLFCLRRKVLGTKSLAGNLKKVSD